MIHLYLYICNTKSPGCISRKQQKEIRASTPSCTYFFLLKMHIFIYLFWLICLVPPYKPECCLSVPILTVAVLPIPSTARSHTCPKPQRIDFLFLLSHSAPYRLAVEAERAFTPSKSNIADKSRRSPRPACLPYLIACKFSSVCRLHCYYGFLAT